MCVLLVCICVQPSWALLPYGWMTVTSVKQEQVVLSTSVMKGGEGKVVYPPVCMGMVHCLLYLVGDPFQSNPYLVDCLICEQQAGG